MGNTAFASRPSQRLQTEIERTAVADVMSRDVVCAEPDLRIEALAELLDARAISGVPVVDRAGHVVGVVSRTDLVAACLCDTRDGATVKDIMMSMAFSLPEGATLAHAIAIMACEGVHRVPVIGARGQVVGIVSSLDIVRWLAAEDTDSAIP